MGEMTNENKTVIVEMHACHNQNDCYCHEHVYNKINLLQ